MADFLADHSVPWTSKLYEELSDEIAEACVTQEATQVWKLFFNGASRANPHRAITAGVGVMLVSPNVHVILRGFSLIEPCTNNVAEYNAQLLGMKFAEKLNIRHLEAYIDSQLIINQARGEYEVRHEDLIPYYFAVLKQAEKLEGFFIEYIPRAQNAYADALASLATSLALPPWAEIMIPVTGRELYYYKILVRESSGKITIGEVCTTSMEFESRD